jgi:parallel beta-helix repeat protein
MCGVAPAALATSYYMRIDPNEQSEAEVGQASQAVWLRSVKDLESKIFEHGDALLLPCGKAIEGPIRIKVSAGASEGVMKISSYGRCPQGVKATISGATKLSGRQAVLSGLRYTDVSDAITQVFINGLVVPEARYPAAGYAKLLKPTGDSGKLSEIDLLVKGRSLDGALLRARTQEWTIEERVLRLAPSGGSEPETEFRYKIRPGVGVYLTGKSWMLNAVEHGWVYDRSNKQLILKGVDRDSDLKVTKDLPLLTVEGQGSIAIDGLRLEHSGGDALAINVSGSAAVSGVEVQDSYRNGVVITGASYGVVQDSLIRGTGQDGVLLKGVKQAVISRNRLYKVGLLGYPQSTVAAINAHGTQAAVIDRNWIDGTGYVGIRHMGGAKVTSNVVLNTCQNLSDCAGIYTWRRSYAHVTPPCLIAGNLVLNVSGDKSVKFGVNDWFVGIYLDEYTRDVRVVGNILAGVSQGIYLHNAVGNEIIDNLLVVDKYKQIVEKFDAPEFSAVNGRTNSAKSNVTVDVPSIEWASVNVQVPEVNSHVAVDFVGVRFLIGWREWNSEQLSASFGGICQRIGFATQTPISGVMLPAVAMKCNASK